MNSVWDVAAIDLNLLPTKQSLQSLLMLCFRALCSTHLQVETETHHEKEEHAQEPSRVCLVPTRTLRVLEPGLVHAGGKEPGHQGWKRPQICA